MPGMTWHLETARLALRPLVADDIDPLHRVLSDVRSMRFYPRPFDRDDTRGWVDRIRERYAADGFGLLAVVEKPTGDVIGDCGPMIMDVDGSRFVELAWHIRPDRQRQGFASEAGAVCRDHAWEAVPTDRLISLIRPENVPSWSVARKLGFAPWRSTVRSGMGHIVWILEHPASAS